VKHTIRAALFDFDETMIDLEAQHEAAHRALCAAMGSDYDALPETLTNRSGFRIIDDVRDFRDFFGWDEPEEKLLAIRHRRFVDACRASKMELLPGVERVVRDLHSHGIRLAVTTSAMGDVVDEILRRVHLREFFEVIVDGDDVKIGKPDPEAYLITAQKLDVAPPDCMVFEDSRVGVLAAKAAGMMCIAVRHRKARVWQDLSAADQVLESFEQFDAARVSSRASVSESRDPLT
jgi:HAD superfamily hydrolase (TIGR01509 family)